jgi:hypothetical protein
LERIMASSKPSFPQPSEPNLRRLGVGPGGAERPLRAQLVVAGVTALLIIAIPLYLLRRPAGDMAKRDAAAALASGGLIRSTLDAGPPTQPIRLGAVQRVKCSAAANRDGNEGSLCDRLPMLEEELERAIKSNVDCAPKTGQEGTINYVLTLNFNKKQIHVFPGASGQWKGPQAKAAAKCVKRSLPDVDWDGIPHRYRYYVIAVMATYPAPDPLETLPEFE